MPIVLTGLVTVLILVGIIIFGNNPQETELEEVDLDALISDHTYIRGDLGAQFTLVEFSDFQCPACKAFAPVVKQILATYPDEVRLAYRHFPLPQHSHARLAAEAAQAAGEQDAFWEYHDKLFENQDALEEENLITYAQELGLDVDQFKEDLDNGKFAPVIQADVDTANNIGVNSTPTFYLNGKKLNLTSPNSLFQIVSFEIENSKTDPISAGGDDQETGDNSNASLLQKVQQPFVVSYTESGFTPSSVEVLIGQTIVWRNTTESSVEFSPTRDVYEDFPEVVTLAPGEEFSYEMTQEGLFPVREALDKHQGMVVVIQLEEAQ